MRRKIILTIMFVLACEPLFAEVLIGKDQYLYVPKSDNRRLLLEPGSILLRKPIPKAEVYKKRTRVITSGGVEGEVRTRYVDSVNDMNNMLAYVKEEIEIKRNKYSIGTIFPVEVIDDEEDILYKITYPRPTYSVKHSGFLTKTKTIEYSEGEFNAFFNLIDPATVTGYKFPLWVEDPGHKPTVWGCKDSEVITRTVDAATGAEAEAGGGFFGFFKAKAEASVGASTSTVFKRELKDESHKHKITYFLLKSASNQARTLLRVALEKISECDKNKGVANNYIIRFENKYNLDDITINSAWVTAKKFKKGGGSPVRIDSQSELHGFENALNDFKFKHVVDGYDVKRAILDFAVQYTVNLNLANGG